MQKRTWIRTGAGVVAFSALVALAGLAAPSLLDIDQYKPAMIAAVKEATGRELVIEGPLKLTVFRRRASAPGRSISPMPWAPRAPRWWMSAGSA